MIRKFLLITGMHMLNFSVAKANEYWRPTITALY